MSDDQRRRAAVRKAVEKAKHNRDRARRKLLQQRRKLARRRRRNRDRVEGNRAETRADDAEKPSAHSTVPRSDTNAEAAARSSTSTVPERPEGSSVEPRRRLYGLRLHRRAEGTGDGGDREREDG